MSYLISIGKVAGKLLAALITWALVLGYSSKVLNYLYPPGKEGANVWVSLTLSIGAAVAAWWVLSGNDSKESSSSEEEPNQQSTVDSSKERTNTENTSNQTSLTGIVEDILNKASSAIEGMKSGKEPKGGDSEMDLSISESSDKPKKNRAKWGAGNSEPPYVYDVDWGTIYTWKSKLIIHSNRLEINPISRKGGGVNISPSSIKDVNEGEKGIIITTSKSVEGFRNQDDKTEALKFENKGEIEEAKENIFDMINGNIGGSEREGRESKSDAEELKKYHNLMREGAITEQEYEKKKKEILNG